MASLRCPSSQDLAAFVDGTRHGKKWRRLCAHLAECETCYQVFVESGRLRPERADTAGKASVFLRSRWLTGSAAALAAAALLVLAIRWPLVPPTVAPPARPTRSIDGGPSARSLPASGLAGKPTPNPFDPGLAAGVSPPPPATTETGSGFPSCRTLAQRVVQAAAGPGDSPRVEAPADGGLAFTDRVTREERAFRLGAALLDFEVSVQREDRPAACQATNRLLENTRALALSGKLQANLQAVKPGLVAGKPFSGLYGLSRQVEAEITDFEDRLFLDLGKWAEAGQLAVRLNPGKFLVVSEWRHLAGRLPKKVLPPGVLAALAEIDQSLRQLPAERDPDRLERAFSRIVDLLGN